MRPDAKRILIVQVSRIGDTLFATPAIRSIAKAYPEAEITVMGHPSRAEVFDNLPFVGKVGEITKNTARWLGWFGGKAYDLTFVFNFDQPLVSYALRVSRKVVAFRQKNPALNNQLHACVEPPPFQSEHAVLQLLRLPAALGISQDGLRLAYHCTESETTRARARLATTRGHDAAPLIGLQVRSFPTKAYRDWPLENFAALCERIIARWNGAHFLIFGSRDDLEQTTWLKSRLGPSATLLAGQLSLRETAAMMGLTNCYVGVDTGPTHLMSTWDIPLVGMYHCLSPSAHTGPLDHPLAYLIDHPAAGSANCRATSVMADITVEAVLARVTEALSADDAFSGLGTNTAADEPVQSAKGGNTAHADFRP